MDALDGNAIAGTLRDVYGAEMTAVVGTCRRCGIRAALAETAVYTQSPGVVMRCRSCHTVLMVLVNDGANVNAYQVAIALPDLGAASHQARR